jgi:HPt (histidine-containing phosphotransfer) domain-containing protein
MSTIENTSENPVLTRLHELVQETDLDFVIELIDLYLNEAPTQMQAIKKALDAQDHQMLILTAHTLKGSSLNLGAKQLGAAFYKLEELGRSNSPISAAVSTKDIESEFDKVKAIFLTFKLNKQ